MHINITLYRQHHELIDKYANIIGVWGLGSATGINILHDIKQSLPSKTVWFQSNGIIVRQYGIIIGSSTTTETLTI